MGCWKRFIIILFNRVVRGGYGVGNRVGAITELDLLFDLIKVEFK